MKRGWKDLDYWVRGGIISVVIVIILYFLISYLPKIVAYELFLFPYLVSKLIIGSGEIKLNFMDKFVLSSFALVFYFFVGGVYGWLFGRIKKFKIKK